MELNEQKQQFSVAFVRAVAAAAGFAVSQHSVDDDSIDIGFVAGGALRKRPRIEAQLKCSADDTLRSSDFSFRLSQKNHNDLCAESLVPRILIVVRIPPDLGDWLILNEERLLARHCAYWLSLAGREEVTAATVTVRMLRAQIFDASALTGLMARAEAGETL